jgi:hypothetical protein
VPHTEAMLYSQGSRSSIVWACPRSCRSRPTAGSLCRVSVIAALVLALLEQSWPWRRATAPCCSASNTAARLLGCTRQIELTQCQLCPIHGILFSRTGVTSFAREGHQRMCVQHPGLVVGGFEDGGASHGGFRGGDEGEVLARDT